MSQRVLNVAHMPFKQIATSCLCWTLFSLRIQVCPKKGINPTILLWGWDWDHQTYSREGYGSLGSVNDNWSQVGGFGLIKSVTKHRRKPPSLTCLHLVASEANFLHQIHGFHRPWMFSNQHPWSSPQRTFLGLKGLRCDDAVCWNSTFPQLHLRQKTASHWSTDFSGSNLKGGLGKIGSIYRLHTSYALP